MGKHHHHHRDYNEYNEYLTRRRAIDKIMNNVLNVEAISRPSVYFNREQASQVAQLLGIDFGSSGYDIEQFRTGMDVELEHGTVNLLTNVTNDDPVLTGKIALAHLNEYPDYYKRLLKMEAEAKKDKQGKKKRVRFI